LLAVLVEEVLVVLVAMVVHLQVQLEPQEQQTLAVVVVVGLLAQQEALVPVVQALLLLDTQ
jgi:hypothetical protein